MNKLVFAFTLLYFSASFASRLPPTEVKPVEYGDYLISAPLWMNEHKGMKHNGGYIRVVEKKSKKELCLREAYEVTYDPQMETDVQDSFIKEMKIEGKELAIKGSRNKSARFPLDNLCEGTVAKKITAAQIYLMQYLGKGIEYCVLKGDKSIVFDSPKSENELSIDTSPFYLYLHSCISELKKKCEDSKNASDEDCIKVYQQMKQMKEAANLPDYTGSFK